MLRVTATQARRQFFDLLDRVESGEEVRLDRRGASFRIQLVPPADPATPPACPVTVLDPALLDGDWGWDLGPDGQLVPR